MAQARGTRAGHFLQHRPVGGNRLTLGVLCDECEGEAQALNWAYYYLGRYRCDAVQLFRSLDTYGNPVDLVAEITPPDRYAENDAQATEREKID